MDLHSDVKYCSSLVSVTCGFSIIIQPCHTLVPVDEIYYFIPYSETTALLKMHITRTTKTKHLVDEFLGG